MSTTPSAERQDADHYEHQRRVEREGAIAQLVAAAQAAEQIAALAEFPSDEWLAAGRRMARLGSTLRAAIAKAKGGA